MYITITLFLFMINLFSFSDRFVDKEHMLKCSLSVIYISMSYWSIEW